MADSTQARPKVTAENPGHPGLRYKRIVVKAGTSVLTRAPDHRALELNVIGDLVRQICALRKESAEVLLVTSGAIAAGAEALDSSSHALGRDITTRQVLAAVGQSRLMHTYQELFAAHGVRIAQTLLTTNDLSDRQSYLNVRNTLWGLLELGIVPVLNENDVVAVDEIGEVFGDNDRLSALVAALVDADLLLILTDTEGLYTNDPRIDPSARLIPEVDQVDAGIEALATNRQNPWARGGMPTKLEAARLVTASGIPMIMCHGLAQNAAIRVAKGERIGTLFHPGPGKLEARKRWMLSSVSQRGGVTIDVGAVAALRQHHGSLLPAGISGVEGEFRRGDIIRIVTPEGHGVACGIANYGSADIAMVRGMQSDQIRGTLGYDYGNEVVHRNNLVLL